MIVKDKEICNGKPIVKGTRITVKTVLEYLKLNNYELDLLLKDFPSLEPQDIIDCLVYNERRKLWKVKIN